MDYRTVVYGGVVLFHAFMFITRKKKMITTMGGGKQQK
jgi:hypothetical protein